MKTSSCCGAGGRRMPAWFAVALSWAISPRSSCSRSVAAHRILPFTLQPGSLWRIEGASEGLRIECKVGSLWLTQEGMAADVVLRAGRTFVFGGSGSILVQPLRDPAGGPTAVRGVLTPAVGAPRPELRESPRSIVHSRIGSDLVPRAHDDFWEPLVWTALWISGAFTIGWWIKAVQLLPWPR